MKKFSKLITESKSETRKMGPLTNPVDWEEIFKPLIEHIDNNLNSSVSGPGRGVFSDDTKSLLNQFLDKVEEDYKEYFQYEIHDGSQESFLSAFNINVDHEDIMDCIRPILDRTDDVEDTGDFDLGAFVVDITGINYDTNEEISEDIADIHGKLKMLNADFTIKVVKFRDHTLIRETGSLSLTKKSTDVDKMLLGGLSDGQKIGNIIVYVYNKETLSADHFVRSRLVVDL